MHYAITCRLAALVFTQRNKQTNFHVYTYTSTSQHFPIKLSNEVYTF